MRGGSHLAPYRSSVTARCNRNGLGGLEKPLRVWGLASLASERPLCQQSEGRSREANVEAEDLEKRSEKGNKYHSVALRIEVSSLPRLVTKVSEQEMKGWKGKSSPRLWLKWPQGCWILRHEHKKGKNEADWDTRALCWESRHTINQRDSPLHSGSPPQGLFLLLVCS